MGQLPGAAPRVQRARLSQAQEIATIPPKAPLFKIHQDTTTSRKDSPVDKMPAYRWRDAHRLASFLRGAGPKIAKALESDMAAVLEDGEELPDLAHLLDVLGRMVLAKQVELDARDDEKADHNAEAASARLELRRDAMPLLRSRVKEVRKWLRGHLADEEIEKLLRFKGRTPRSDEPLEDLATIMVRELPKLKPFQTPAGPVDPAHWAEYLRQPLEHASGLLGEIDRCIERRILCTEQKAKAMKVYDTLFRRIARIGWIFCYMGGRERDAHKLVYKGGRPGVKVKKRRRPTGVA